MFLRIIWWNNFENRSIFAKIVIKHQECSHLCPRSSQLRYALRLVKRALDLVIYALDLSKHALDLVIYALDLIKHALDLINYVIDQVNYEEVYSPYMSSFKACMGVQMMYS